MAIERPGSDPVERLKKARQVRVRLNSVLDTIGTSNYAQRPDLNPENYSGLERVSARIKVGNIRKGIAEKTIPRIDQYIEELEPVSLEAEMLELVESGYLEQADLDEARNLLDRTKEDVTPDLAGEEKTKIRPVVGVTPQPEKTAGVETKEAEALPKIVINLETKQISLDGVDSKKFGKISFAVLYLLARSRGKYVAHERVAAVAKRAGSKNISRAGGQAIDGVRNAFVNLRYGGNVHTIIETNTRGLYSAYRLNAEVEFVGETRAQRSAKGNSVVNEVRLPDGQNLEIRGNLRSSLIEVVAERMTLETAIDHDDLVTQVYGVYSRENADLLDHVLSAAKKELQAAGWTIEQPVTHKQKAVGKRAKYYLAKIDVDKSAISTPVASTVAEQKKPWEPLPVHETRLKALDLLTSDVNVPADQLIKALGNMRNGRPHPKHQAVNALLNAFRRLSNRSYLRVISPKENETYQKVLSFFDVEKVSNYKEFQSVLNTLRQYVLEAFEVKPEEVKDVEGMDGVEETEQILSYAEAFVLVGVLRQRSALLRKYGLPEFPQEVATTILTSLQQTLKEGRVSQEDILRLRESAVNKVISVLGLPNLVELFISQPEEIQEIVDFFDKIHQKQEAAENVLREILTKKLDTGWSDDRFGRVDRVWSEIDVSDITTEAPNGHTNGHNGADKKHLDVKTVQAKSDAVGRVAKFEASPIRVKSPTELIENRDADARKRVHEIFDILDQHHVNGEITGGAIREIFSNLKGSFVERMTERKYVRPINHGSGAYKIFYSVEDVVLLRYLKLHGEGFPKNVVSSLKLLISEVKQAREVRKVKSS